MQRISSPDQLDVGRATGHELSIRDRARGGGSNMIVRAGGARPALEFKIRGLFAASMADNEDTRARLRQAFISP
ncbi:MAG: hypothetical protein WB999_02810 [Candidatus Binataceae bacterium]